MGKNIENERPCRAEALAEADDQDGRGCEGEGGKIILPEVKRSKKRAMKKLSPMAICPCGSGKNYRQCCWKKDFDWVVDKNGKIHRRIPMHPIVKEGITELGQQFAHQFGREPSSNDLLFFDKFSERHRDQVLSEAFTAVGIDPAYFYAYQKTGLFVWEGNVSLIPDKDIREWKSAVREFRKLQKREPSLAGSATLGWRAQSLWD